MKLVLGWVIFSSLASLFIVVNAHKVIPVGELTEKDIITSTELYILNDLLNKEQVNKDTVRALIGERMVYFKDDVLSSQIESMPVGFIYFSLLVLNILNIIFMFIGLWHVKKQDA